MRRRPPMDDNERKGVGMKTTTKTEIKPNATVKAYIQLVVVVVLISFPKLVVAMKNIIHFYE